jgi:gliding motility-associated-like protein
MATGQLTTRAQTTLGSTTDSVLGFNEQAERAFFLQHHSHEATCYNEFVASKRRKYEKEQINNNRIIPVTPSTQAACTNMDFEVGNLTGWVTSTGFNPLYDSQGCCLSGGGAQTITSGTGVDPCGGFPVVAAGGSFSVRLGDDNVNGVADRLEQTFTVTQANANYTYRYAVVLEEPGHTAAEQPSFQVEMLNSAGVQIPCTFYQVSAGQGIPGFQNSNNCNGVIFKPWTTVSVDLSNYVGQNVTIRFTTYDCSLGGHFAYAYIDGSCVSYGITQTDSLCVGGTTNICAPQGFQTYTWSGPGIVSQSGNCATINSAGNYAVQLTTVTGCNTPLINYHVSNYATPQAIFNTVGGNNACNLNVAFNNNSVGAGNQQLQFQWDFGDGTASFMEQPTHSYLSSGTYTVTLIATALLTGCSDTTTQVIIIDVPPAPLFSTAGVCAGSTVTFNNNTVGVGQGNANWMWNFGDNTTATTYNTSHMYAVAGTYNVSLTFTNNHGCVGLTTAQVTIAPLPVALFSANSVCLGQATAFTDNSSIASGSIINWQWDFNGDGVGDNVLSNPIYTLANAGANTVELTVISNIGCVSTGIGLATVYPNPTAAFSTNNVCANAFAVFQNTSIVALPSQISTYTWDFGDSQNASLTNPSHQYTTAGTYQVNLSVATNQGCSNSFSFPITIFPLPTTIFASTIECETQATQFSDQSSVVGGTIVSRVWDFNNDGITDATNVTNPTHTYVTPGLFNAKLETVTNSGCYNQVINQVVVHTNPIAYFSGSAQCLGDATSFSNASSSSDGAIVSYNWDYTTDGAVDNVSQSPSHNFPSHGTFLTTLEIQTEYGCEASYASSIEVNPNPDVQFTAPSNASCPLRCVDFTNLSSIATGAIDRFNWDFGDGTTEENAVGHHCYESGKYTVSLFAVSDKGCSSSVVKSNIIYVYPAPQAGFTLSTEDEIDLINPEISIQNTSQGATTIDYSVSDGYTTSTTDFVHVFNNDVAQAYSILQVVVNTFGCRDSVEKKVEVKPAFTFYIPNAFSPNDDGINDAFRGDGIGIEKYKMWVFDRWGNMIFFTEDLDKSWNGTVQGKSGNTVMQDIYVWKVELKDVFNKPHNYHGTVDVVR